VRKGWRDGVEERERMITFANHADSYAFHVTAVFTPRSIGAGDFASRTTSTLECSDVLCRTPNEERLQSEKWCLIRNVYNNPTSFHIL